jgi:TonB family protein
MRRVTLLAALILAAGCASTVAPDGSPSSGVTSSAATVPGKIAFGQASMDHPYFIRVQEQISAKWGFPLVAGKGGLEGDLLIELRIAKDGSLDRVWLLRSSGVPAFDEAALTAVQGAQPFPPVPDEVAKQTLAINAPSATGSRRSSGYNRAMTTTDKRAAPARVYYRQG